MSPEPYDHQAQLKMILRKFWRIAAILYRQRKPCQKAPVADIRIEERVAWVAKQRAYS